MGRIDAWTAAAAVLVAACGCGSGGETAERGRGGADRVVIGTVTRASGAEIAVRGEGDRAVTLRMDPRTAVTLDGRPATPLQIVEGAAVRASYRTGERGEAIAVNVDANSATSGATRSYGSDGAQRGRASGVEAPARNGARNGAHGGQGSAPAGDSGPGAPRE